MAITLFEDGAIAAAIVIGLILTVRGITVRIIHKRNGKNGE